MKPSGESSRLTCGQTRIDPLMVDPLSYFSFQPVLHDWCNKGRGVCYPVLCDGAYKRPLAVNRNIS